MSHEYDFIATAYRDSKHHPWRKYIEEYTLFETLGDIRDKQVLNLAYGKGFYTRKLKQAGAAHVIGNDPAGRERRAEPPARLHLSQSGCGRAGTLPSMWRWPCIC